MKSFVLSFLATCSLMLVISSLMRHQTGSHSLPLASAHAESISAQPAEKAGKGASTTGEQPASDAQAAPSDSQKNQENAAERIAALTSQARLLATGSKQNLNRNAWWTVICELAELDPVLAIRILREAPTGFASTFKHDQQSGNTQSIVAWWAARDPDAALDWYWRDLAASGSARPESPDDIINTLAGRSIPEAVKFVQHWRDLNPSPDSSRSFGYYGDGLKAKTASSDFSSIYLNLIPWLKTADDLRLLLPPASGAGSTPPSPGFWQGLADAAAQVLPPAEARSFLDANPWPGSWPNDYQHPAVSLMHSAFRNNASGNPGDWADWVMRSVGPESQLRNQAAVNLLREWAPKDPEAAGNWLRTFAADNPASAPMAMKTYAETVLTENPSAAMEWVTAIPQESSRRLAMIQLFPKWAEQDPAAARSWLDNANWPPEMKRLGQGALKAAAAGW